MLQVHGIRKWSRQPLRVLQKNGQGHICFPACEQIVMDEDRNHEDWLGSASSQESGSCQRRRREGGGAVPATWRAAAFLRNPFDDEHKFRGVAETRYLPALLSCIQQ